MRSCLLLMLSDLSVPWGTRRKQWTLLSGVEERATRLWRANLSLCQGVSLNVGDSKRPSALACVPVPVVRLWTLSSRKKEKIALTVHERVVKSALLARTSTNFNVSLFFRQPVSVIPLGTCSCWSLCMVHVGVSCFRHRRQGRNISQSWKPMLLCRFVSIIGRRARGRAKRVPILVGLVGGHFWFPPWGARRVVEMCRAPRSTAALALT